MVTDKEIEAAAAQIHHDMGCTITAARVCALRALAAAKKVRAGEWNEAIDAALKRIPNGRLCDAQTVADSIVSLKRNTENGTGPLS